jgi:hypothetical protein
VNAGIGGMGEPWAGGSGSSKIPSRVSRRAAEAAGQLADPVDRSICRPSAQIPIRSEDFPPWTEGVPADDHRRSSVTLQPSDRSEARLEMPVVERIARMGLRAVEGRWGALIALRPATSEFSRAQRTLEGPRRSPVRSEPAPALRGAGTARPVKEG